jgi:hypothetical protein
MLVLHEGLADAVKIVSFIKAGLLNSCVWNFMFGDGFWTYTLITSHRSLLATKYVAKTLCAKTRSTCISFEQEVWTCKSFGQHRLLSKLAYLIDLFGNLSDLKLSVQGRSKHIFTYVERVMGAAVAQAV